MIACASFLGDNWRPVYARIVAHLQEALGAPAGLLPPREWAEQHRMLDEGEIQVAFLCGLPYVEKHDRPGRPLELLAAPIMAAPRYQGRPVYFTDVIVQSASPVTDFAGLRGATWAYNGSDSNSGYNMPRDFLLRRGATNGFFGRTVESGSHQRSIEMVLRGEADASAIDSLVLEMEATLRPALAGALRVVEAIGPCPIPPVVASTRLPAATRARLRQALLTMHESAAGRAVLRDGLLDRFTAVNDADYDPIRDMLRRAQQAGFVELR